MAVGLAQPVVVSPKAFCNVTERSGFVTEGIDAKSRAFFETLGMPIFRQDRPAGYETYSLVMPARGVVQTRD